MSRPVGLSHRSKRTIAPQVDDRNRGEELAMVQRQDRQYSYSIAGIAIPSFSRPGQGNDEGTTNPDLGPQAGIGPWAGDGLGRGLLGLLV